MKKIIGFLILAIIAVVPVFSEETEIAETEAAQKKTEKDITAEFTVFGGFKTGIYYEQRRILEDTYSHTRMYNNDGDSGDAEGRLRFGMELKLGNFGMKTLFTQSNFKSPVNQNDRLTYEIIEVGYAYAYANLVKNQIKISAGLLGDSPWNTGGPELNKELEPNGNNPLIGIRTELKPTFVSWLSGLNIGFVLGMDNDPTDIASPEKFGDLFLDSIVGIGWDHKYFQFSFAYRFSRPTFSAAAQQGGEQFIYRVEERLLGIVAPGLQISANGYCQGLGGTEGRGIIINFTNWIYIRYDNDFLTAGVDLRYEDTLVNDQQYLELRPMFIYKFFDNFFSLGVTAGIEFGFNGGRERNDDSIFNFWYIEPQARLNINGNFYISAFYRYTAGLYRQSRMSYEPDQDTHWFNLRFCFSF